MYQLPDIWCLSYSSHLQGMESNWYIIIMHCDKLCIIICETQWYHYTQRGICICTKTWRYKSRNYDLRFLEYSGMFMSGESREEGLKVMVWNVVWRVDIGQIQILCTTLMNFNNRITGRFETWQRLDLMCFREMILPGGACMD